MLNFKECDIELCKLVENNPADPKIYQKVHDLAFNYLYNVCKPGTDKYDYETISWDLASDVFLRLQKGTVIQYWTCYVSKIINCYYLHQYEKDNWSIVIDTTQDENLERNILESCVGVRDSDYSQIENNLTSVYLSQFYSVLNEIMQDTKFKFNSISRLNLQISVLLTLIKNKPTYFRITEDLYAYVNVIIAKVKHHLIEDGLFSRENTLQHLDISQLRNCDYDTNND